jgi:hypothetical protein
VYVHRANLAIRVPPYWGHRTGDSIPQNYRRHLMQCSPSDFCIVSSDADLYTASESLVPDVATMQPCTSRIHFHVSYMTDVKDTWAFENTTPLITSVQGLVTYWCHPMDCAGTTNLTRLDPRKMKKRIDHLDRYEAAHSPAFDLIAGC